MSYAYLHVVRIYCRMYVCMCVCVHAEDLKRSPNTRPGISQSLNKTALKPQLDSPEPRHTEAGKPSMPLSSPKTLYTP